jgi:hypothetical protein
MSHNVIKRTFEREGLRTPGGGKHWDHSFFRLSILSDLYRPHTYEEAASAVSPEAAARLDRSKHYSLWWFNRLKTKPKQVSEVSENGRVYHRETTRSVKPKEEWIAVPVSNSGIPREIVEAARERIKENRTPSRAGRRTWELSGGIIYCGGCGRRMGFHNGLARSKKYPYHYYRGPAHNQHLEDCPQDKNIRADEIENAVWDLVSGLLMDPDRLAEGLEEVIDREQEELRGDPDQQAKMWADKLTNVGVKRAKFQDMAADGLITFDELREKLAQLDEMRQVADWELNNLQYRRERLAQLEEDKARLLDDFAGIMPEAVAKLTGETRRRVYNLLRVKVVVGVKGEVEVSGAIGEAVCVAGDQPSSIPEATGFSIDGLRAGVASSPSTIWARRLCSGGSRPGTESSPVSAT